MSKTRPTWSENGIDSASSSRRARRTSRPSASRDVDVAIVGGGPGGTACAIALSLRGRTTLVAERSRYEAVRIGETLPPRIRPLLTTLGVWETFLEQGHLPSFSTRAAWGSARLHANDFICDPDGSGWHTDRARFDAMLAREAERTGAVVCRGAAVVSCDRDPVSGWTVGLSTGDGAVEVRARFLVDATGRRSWLARREGARPIVHDRLIGVAAFSRAGATRNFSAGNFILLEAVEDGWWYSAPLPDKQIVVTFMTDADLYSQRARESRAYWRHQLDCTRATKARVGAYDLGEPPSGGQVLSATSYRLDAAHGRDWLATGDAAMALDPLSAQGVYRAIALGLDAATTVDDHLAGDARSCSRYSRRIVGTFHRYLRSRAFYYSQERRWRHSPFWARRSKSPADIAQGEARRR